MRVKVALAFATAIVVLAGIGSLVYVHASRFTRAFEWVAHSHEELQTLRATLFAIQSADSSGRAYIATGHASHLKEFRAAVDQLTLSLDRLQALAASHSDQSERFGRLEPLVRSRIAALEEAVRLRDERGLDPPAQASPSETGAQAMDHIRAVCLEMQDFENRTLEERRARTEESIRTTVMTISAVILIALAVLLMAALVVNREMVRRARAEEAQRAGEERFRVFMDNSPAVAFLKDADGRMEYVNKPFLSLFKMTCADVLGKADHELWPPEVAKELREHDLEVFSQNKTIRTYEKVPLPDEGLRSWLVYKFPVQSRNGRPLLGGMAVDITDLKNAEEALAREASELLRSNADMEQFAYAASHDLKEPLRMVAGSTGLLAMKYKGKLGPDADELIGFAVEGANRMQQLIDDLLAYASVGKGARDFEPTDTEAVLRQALGNVKSAIDESRAVVTHDALPTVTANASQLVHVFQNLIANAIKFQGKEPPRIHVSARRQEKEWVFSVRDNGIGIAPEYADRIFRIFQRLHHRAEYPGSGIGLAICRKIVEHHNGRIWLESSLGNGATFHFTIPIPE